ncbi:MAG: CDP-glycerol--glycerophosphate glycerophosphotransferase [Gemmatimonadetes bacterium]|nr:CDP-glycerol--glycerophosphate glycerophosphotransferase [Gemmatimonadota bacterium]
MRAVLFCQQPYAFGILEPLADELGARGHEVLWYVRPKYQALFPFAADARSTASLADLVAFRSDAIFIPGNEVPDYLRGVKVQMFHGLAGEKRGHFRVHHYFDLYLTQGPYFTRRFEAFARRHRDFEVRETGWCKLDPLYASVPGRRAERDALLAHAGKAALVLYAPTFSPSLTSAYALREVLFELADRERIHLLVKFHDLMHPAAVASYRALAAARANVEIVPDRNILRVLAMADLMISDTSSAVYEFILLDRPAITLNSASPNICWRNIRRAAELPAALREELREDRFRERRREIVAQYHPYADGQSSARMIEAVEDYIRRNGVPEERRLNLYRRYRLHQKFGKRPT